MYGATTKFFHTAKKKDSRSDQDINFQFCVRRSSEPRRHQRRQSVRLRASGGGCLLPPPSTFHLPLSTFHLSPSTFHLPPSTFHFNSYLILLQHWQVHSTHLSLSLALLLHPSLSLYSTLVTLSLFTVLPSLIHSLSHINITIHIAATTLSRASHCTAPVCH